MACYLGTPEAKDEIWKYYFSIGHANYAVPDGLFADSKSQPMSMERFFVIMVIGGALTMHYLNKRKNKILEEAYSKLSIFNK